MIRRRDVNVTKKVQETEITITMTENQALALAQVLSSVGGSPTLSRRGYIEDILSGLRNAGINYDFPPVDFNRFYFTDLK